ncbi:NYN domain-containing protein [Celeribacter sp.]|uniref:LabA-like NYN domain-containing protein n=1 Tax=Celeribacter sp. TaxID=1890673 RepID=UPI003A923334
MFYKDDRTAVFIDGPNAHAAAKNLGMDLDYKKIRSFMTGSCKLVRIFYYTAILENDEYSPIRPLVDWLSYNGFTVVTKPAKEFTDSMGNRKIKGNMDIDIAVDCLDIANSVDHIVLFTGDGDFQPLVAALQRRGVRVTVASTIRTSPAMIADELRRAADVFLEMEVMREHFARPERPQTHAAE